MKSDPAVALMLSRRTTEAICKLIFCDKISTNTPNGLDELLQILSKGNHIPKHVLPHLKSIQNHGNFGAHDQGDDSDEITEDFVEPCIKSVDFLCKWLLKDYLGGEYQTKPLVKEPAKEFKKDVAAEKDGYPKPPRTNLDSAELELVLPKDLIKQLKDFAKYKKRRPRDIVIFWIENYARF